MHRSREDAVQQLASLRRMRANAYRRRTESLGEPRPYRCQYCDTWHLGHDRRPVRLS